MQRVGTGSRIVAGTIACFAILFGIFSTAAAAQEPELVESDLAQELADRYAPIIMLKSQDAPCDTNGESYGPASVEIVLDNPEVLLRQLTRGDPVIQRGPGAADLFELGGGFYLDFPGGALDPGCLYETDFNRYAADHPPTVYAHIVSQDDHPDELALQYWIYWYYNDWNNKHESDWEGIQLLFEASSIAEALGSEPVEVGYAQHEGGERADWDSTKLKRDSTHPLVYSSAGSHASYFNPALYLGRSGGEGFGCDNTDGPSDRVEPEAVVLPDAVDDPDDPLAWLAFDGRWGERQDGPFNGPTGPAAKERWLAPIDWHEELRSSSVVIPGGDSIGASVILVFCDLVEWGSGTLIEFTTSPARLLIVLAALVLIARGLIRRSDWSKVAPLPLRRRRRAGQILRAAGSVYRGSAIALLTFGLVFLPTAVLVGLLGGLIAALPLIGDLLGVAGRASGTNLALALLVSSIPTVAAYVMVNAMVVVYLDGRERGEAKPATACVHLVWLRRRDLFLGFIRSFAIVYVLLISVVGAPWGIRQLVRYQFMPQVIMLEGLEGKAGLERSSELVTGRWWHTGFLIALFNGLAGLAGLVLGLLLLLTFTGLPMWLLAALVTLTSALVVPGTSVALAMLYGDAVAEKDGAERAELLEV